MHKPLETRTGDASDERSKRLAWNRAALLSTVGAAVAGAGLGSLLPSLAPELGGLILSVGLLAHSLGMIAKRRIESAESYAPQKWEHVAYWTCGIAIVVVLAYLLFVASKTA